MRNWLIAAGIAVIVVVLANRWKHRFGAIRSPLIEQPAYRVLFLLVVIGALLVATQPEAAFVIPALDAVGLDVVTILVALELRHYMTSWARLLGIPTIVAVYRHGPAQLVSRCRDVIRTNPVLWAYACLWAFISIRAFLGKSR
jgi:hypothetical protein